MRRYVEPVKIMAPAPNTMGLADAPAFHDPKALVSYSIILVIYAANPVVADGHLMSIPA